MRNSALKVDFLCTKTALCLCVLVHQKKSGTCISALFFALLLLLTCNHPTICKQSAQPLFRCSYVGYLYYITSKQNEPLLTGRIDIDGCSLLVAD